MNKGIVREYGHVTLCVPGDPFGHPFPHWGLHDFDTSKNDSILSHSEGSQNEPFWDSEMRCFGDSKWVILRLKMSHFETRKWIGNERENESNWIEFKRNESEQIGMDLNELRRIRKNQNESDWSGMNRNKSEWVGINCKESDLRELAKSACELKLMRVANRR